MSDKYTVTMYPPVHGDQSQTIEVQPDQVASYEAKAWSKKKYEPTLAANIAAKPPKKTKKVEHDHDHDHDHS